MDAAGDHEESLRLIRDSASGLAPRDGDLKRVRALRFAQPGFAQPGFDRAVWAAAAGQGWLGLLAPEAAGGAALGMAELCALAEEIGAALLPEPLVAATVAAGLHPDPAVLAGTRIVLPAWQEQAGRIADAPATVFASGRLTGRKLFVAMGAGADAFLVSTAAGAALVEAGAPGLTLTTEATQDGGHFATLAFDHAPARPVPGDMQAALEQATLATSAMLLGVMDRAFAMTLDYLRTRKQFGRVIGSFQSLQHRAADLRIQLALTRASVAAAAATWDAGGPPAPRLAAVSRAKARAGDAALLVTRQCLQLHGGIGYTDDYDLGLFLRRAMVLANQHGSPSGHRARFAATAPDEDDA